VADELGGVTLHCGDALEFLRGLPDDSVDLLFTSPPYLEARTYGIGAGRKLDDWVAWMTEVVTVAAPKVKGLIAVNCEGQTKNYRYLPAPFLLTADLHRAGFNLRKPVVFHRIGIPGSGGPDWLRNDWEPVVCVTRAGKMPWSDNTAMGHTPKWAPGGEMSHRQSNGSRVNQWGHPIASGATVVDAGGVVTSKGRRPSHVGMTKKMYSRNPDGSRDEGEHYAPPVKANPGNLTKRTYTTDEVAALLAETGNVQRCEVGGGVMGHDLAHDNEAPFPLKLAEFFVLSFCPPGGVVCDPFVGSGTTAHAAVLHGRRFVGGDLRQSQIDLTRRRLRGVTPALV
jgi:hypothetical protein